MKPKKVCPNDYEHEAWAKGQLLLGIDEAGRGPLAGPVCAAAVILKPNQIIEGVNDSKKLSEKKREALFDVIKSEVKAYSIAFATVEEIEEMNILNATMLAMKRAVEGLKIKADYALIDGNRLPPLDIKSEYVIKGDAKSMSIAAASILAKVSRDRLCYEYAEKYPQYGFDKHKGYGTKLHTQAIKEYGPCEIHRMSFLKKIL
jgi:ribonuclease HII